MDQLVNQGLQGLVDTAGHQALVDLVALEYLGILVSVALVYLAGQDSAVSVAGLAKSGHLVRQAGQVSVVGLGFQDIADQVYLAIQGTQGILDQALQGIADSVVYLDGLVKLVRLDSAVYLAGLDLVVSVDIQDWDILD